MQTRDHTSPTQKTRTQEFTAALGDHAYRAELICYSLLLVVGVTQIIIRENFPNLNPPWRIIGIALMIVLFSVLLVPPFLAAIRVWKRPESPSVNDAANQELTASPMHPDHRKSLLAELAALDQQIADTEALTALECDDATLQRATELLAEAREMREHAEGKLRAG